MFINLGVCVCVYSVCVCVCVTIKIVKDHNFKRERGVTGETGGRKGKGKHYSCVLSVFIFSYFSFF